MITNQYSNTEDSVSQYKERIANISNDFEFGLFFFLFQKSLMWIIFFFLFAVGFFFLYLRYTFPIYESKVILQIAPEDATNKILNIDKFYENQEDITKSVELIRSKVFLKRALLELPLNVTYFVEGTFRGNEHYNVSDYSAEVSVKEKSIKGVKINVQFENKDVGKIIYPIGNKLRSFKFKSGECLNTPEMDININITNYENIKKQQSIIKENTFYFVVNNIDNLTDDYFPRLNVRILNESAKTIEIIFKDNNAQKTSDIVSTVANSFINYDIEKKNESAKKILPFLDNQLAIVYERLRNVETSMYSFKKENKISDVKNTGDAGLARLNTLEDDMISIELKENVLNEVEKNISEKKNIDSYQMISILTGDEFESMLGNQVNSLSDLLKTREELLYEVTPTSEKIKSIDFQIEVRKKLLLESIRSIKNKISIRKQNLAKKVKEVEGHFFSIPAEEIELSRLQRLFSINEKFYNLLLEKKTEYSIAQAGSVSHHIILENAKIPLYPISPDKNIVLITCLLAALLLSLILILLRYITYNEINSLNDINKLTKATISILGIIPRYKKDIPTSQLLVDKNPKSIIAEAFRSLRTNLQFISNESGPKIAAITSTISGEGKTLVTVNLAAIIAYAGKKVIVMDLDMRKPKIHHSFKIENINGMSTLLIGKDTIDNCIQHSTFENLDFITAGPIPPNPSELIINKRMDDILAYLKTKYDFIVLDTPPVGLVTDGIAIIQKADYPIYILRAEYSKRRFIQNIDRLYNENNIKNISIVLNSVDIDSKNHKHNYGYGYGYGYDYDYSYAEDKLTKEKKRKLFISRMLSKKFF
ncbi:MAG: polysaccharide biosynthesis tyrosine autokinase [Bacteroidota bacterium]